MPDKFTGAYGFVCRHCSQSTDGVRVEMTEGPHAAKLTCSFCGGFLKWLPKDENDKPNQRKRNANLVARDSRGYCVLCMIREDSLTGRETLEGHHVVEVQDGGTDDEANVWIVCSSCHALIHHQRRYRGKVYSGLPVDV